MLQATPFMLARRELAIRSAPKGRLMAVSRSVEARALVEPHGAQIWACLQDEGYFTSRTRAVYRELAEHGVDVHLLARGFEGRTSGIPGLHLHELPGGSPLGAEWNVLLLTPRDGWGLFAQERITDMALADAARPFDWATSEDRDLVQRGVAWLREWLGLNTHAETWGVPAGR